MLSKAFKNVDETVVASSAKPFSFANKGTVKNILVNLSSAEQAINCEELFDTIYAVPLETSDKSILGYINEVQVYHDTIYVRDEWKVKTVKRFDKTGRFIDEIGRHGQGPGEYFQPTSLCVDEHGIVIYDQWQQKIIEYAHDGKLKSERRLPFLASHLFRVSPNNYMFSYLGFQNYHLPTLNNFCLWSTDSVFHVTNKGLYRPDELPSKPNFAQPFTMSNHVLSYADSYTDSLYFITKDNILSCNYILKIQAEEVEDVSLADCSLLTDYLHFVIVKFDDKGYGKSYNCVYSKECDKLFMSDKLSVLNSKNFFYRLGSIRGCFDNYLISNMFASELLGIYDSYSDDKWNEFVEQTRSQQTFEPFRSLCQKLQEDDNDVLVFFKLKDKPI